MPFFVAIRIPRRASPENDTATFVLEPQDLLFIPAHVSYRFANVGREDAFFIDVAAKAETWPPTITYLDEPPA